MKPDSSLVVPKLRPTRDPSAIHAIRVSPRWRKPIGFAVVLAVTKMSRNKREGRSHSRERQPMRISDRLKQLGPSLVTGAADDDPSGIASQFSGGCTARADPVADNSVRLSADGRGPTRQRASDVLPGTVSAIASAKSRRVRQSSCLWRSCFARTRSISGLMSRGWAQPPRWSSVEADTASRSCTLRCSPLLQFFLPVMADASAARLYRPALCGDDRLAGCRQGRVRRRTRRRWGDDRRHRHLRHHDQPLLLVLAGVAGGRGNEAG